MNCKYCFRTKNIFSLNKKWKEAIDIIADSGLIDYFNIAGGEPTINKKQLLEILKYISSKKIKSSIITNGIILSEDKLFLDEILNYVDTLGISVDSLDENICKEIGRVDNNNNWLSKEKLDFLNKETKKKNKKFKINIVVSKLNKNDNSLMFINNLEIDKIKILRNQMDGNIDISEMEKLKGLFSNCKNIVMEYNMDDMYIMLDGNLCISTKRIESPKSIFDEHSLQNAYNTLKLSKGNN